MKIKQLEGVINFRERVVPVIRIIPPLVTLNERT